MDTIRKYIPQIKGFIILMFLGLTLLVTIKYSLDKSHIRNVVLEAIREGVAPEKLIDFKFTVSEAKLLDWKKDHEFEVNGEMYDIVETQNHGDTIIYTCFHDTKETKYKRRFYKYLGKLLLPDSEPDKNKSQQKVDIKLYFSEQSACIVETPVILLKEVPFIYLNLYNHLGSGPNSPPPEV